MENADEVEQSWGWLLLLLGISALLMTIWFVLHPLSALLCTVAGMCTCLSSLALGGLRPSAPEFQADGGDN
jgi:hypothetical protein